MPTVVLGLEAIGDDLIHLNRLQQIKMKGLGVPDRLRDINNLAPVLRRPWVAEIIGTDPTYRWARTFLKGNKDYSRANSIGSRGVMVYYRLREGRIYEVNDWMSWSSVDRYFCRVEGGRVIRMTEAEVQDHVG